MFADGFLSAAPTSEPIIIATHVIITASRCPIAHLLIAGGTSRG
jgi:hypothetical protein